MIGSETPAWRAIRPGGLFNSGDGIYTLLDCPASRIHSTSVDGQHLENTMAKAGPCEKHAPEYLESQGKDLTGFRASSNRTKESRPGSKGSRSNKETVRIPTK